MASKTNYQVIDYIHNLTKGLVTLKDEHIEHIKMLLERGDKGGKENAVIVKMMKYDAQAKLYKDFRSFYVNEQIAVAKINKYRGTTQFSGFYKFEITELNFQFETVNERLFES